MAVTLPRIWISEAANYEGQEVIINGWLSNSRSSGSIIFLVLRDGTGIMQGVVIKNQVSKELFELADKLTQESSVVVRGALRKDKRAPGGYELSVSDINIIHHSSGYPITPKEHGIDFLMDHRHLWLRSSRQQAILRIRHEITRACRDFLDERGFVLIDAPILTPSACEGTTNLFQTQYFDSSAYLTQSGQLYMEAAAMAFGKVYCFGPTFRAEKSKTRRHLMEFWMIEPEIAYTDLEQVMDIQEEMVCYIVQRILDQRMNELKLIGRDITLLEKVKSPFPRISYDEAIKLLKEKGQNPQWGNDLGATEETLLSEHFEKPFFIHRFPMACKAFYMKPDPQSPELALCADMLAPEGYGEIIGGGQREDDLQALEERMEKENMDKEPYQWYLDLRRYGSVPHAGFGLGIERTVAWICKLDHVRETIPFPRMLYRMYP